MSLDEILSPLENSRPFAKIAFEGFAGDGKTYTAALTAIGIHKMIQSTKPVVVVDTEKAIDKIKFLFDEAGIEVKVTQSRSLETLSKIIEGCNEGYADVMMLDSITHVWEDFIESYKKSKNRQRIQFEDWGVIKPMWKAKFSTPFVSANTHIIFTGRAGYEYTDEKNEETGKREIFKSGIKMKAETETQFEPDVLILMEKQQEILGKEKKITRTATVIKDRTTVIDGKQFENPTFDDLYPCVSRLLDGTLRELHQVDLPNTFAEFEDQFARLGKEKESLLHDIETCLHYMGVGGSATADKQFRAWMIKQITGQVIGMDNLKKLDLKKLHRIGRIVKTFSDLYYKYSQDCLNESINKDADYVKGLMDEAIGKYEAVV